MSMLLESYLIETLVRFIDSTYNDTLNSSHKRKVFALDMYLVLQLLDLKQNRSNLIGQEMELTSQIAGEVREFAPHIAGFLHLD